MSLAVIDDYFAEIEGRYAFQAGDIDPKLVRVRASLVMRVDAALRAKMMLRDTGVEAVGGELVRSLEHLETTYAAGDSNRSSHPAYRTSAAARACKALGQFRSELNRTAVAGAVHRAWVGGNDGRHQ